MASRKCRVRVSIETGGQKMYKIAFAYQDHYATIFMSIDELVFMT